MDLNRLAAILETIPEAHLDIFNVMWEFTGEDGKFDGTAAAENPAHVARALQQASDYVRQVQSLNRTLEGLCEQPKVE